MVVVLVLRTDGETLFIVYIRIYIWDWIGRDGSGVNGWLTGKAYAGLNCTNIY